MISLVVGCWLKLSAAMLSVANDAVDAVVSRFEVLQRSDLVKVK